MVKTRHQSGLNVFPSLAFSPCKMKTRSRRSNALDDEKDTDSDDSLYTNCFPKRRKKRIGPKLDEHISKYNREISIDMQGAEYPVKRHLSMKVESEGQSSTKIEKIGAMSSIASHPSSNEIYVNGDDSVNEKRSVRRSTRQRKFIYDNLNQTWLLASSIPEFSKLEPLFSTEQRPEQEQQCVSLRPRRSEQTRSYELRRLGLSTAELEFEDMYSRVKRERRKNAHGFYSRRVPQDVGSMADTEETDQNEISDSESGDDVGSDLEEGSRIGGEELQEEGAVNSKYSLRPKKPITERFQFPIEPVRPKRSATVNLFDTTTDHQQSTERESFKSSAHRSPLFRRKRHAIHNSSSTSSSSDDERRFERKKARSMARARNRCLPLNFKEDDLSNGVLRDRGKIGSSLADIDPMSIDKTVSFDSVGGLDHHIQSLKEMILFPLMYPEVFERFKIAPPRGVLFHGPPGTGKTLVARALANECSHGDRRVAFFMRKGADCLSKWVGESERQLRLLFDQAYSMRPSIIFFDEIDGLAPVRSTRQDQIHSSIVSTLLALMDGLDNRGEIVIIGATNRIDAIDPALRRPGRFDRELLFPLPSLEAREKILKINIQQWNPPLPESFILALAARSSGYCGADLKALCTEAALVALRRRYPQIYGSRQKLQLDVDTIQVTAQDFMKAMKQMVPAAQRSAFFSANPLSAVLKPLMGRMLKNAMNKLKKVFPLSLQAKEYTEEPTYSPARNTSALENDASSEDSDSSLFQSEAVTSENSNVQYRTDSLKLPDTVFRQFRFSRYLWPFVHRPRFLLFGAKGQGQGSLAPAILYNLEHVPVHRLDIPALYAVTCRSPEEACALIFQEALRKIPSIIFLPHIGYWWETLAETVRATFLSLLQDLEPCTPLMLLATSDCLFDQLPQEVRDIFSVSEDQIMQMNNPNEEERKLFFSVLLKDIYIKPKKKTKRSFEALPVAPAPETRKLTATELEKLRRSEEATMRELRLFLRDILNKLARDRRFAVFARPVDPVEVPDYQEVIKNPMDLETMRTKIDLHQYETVAGFLADIDLICHNALEYNPDIDPSDKLIRHRACALKDTAHALVLSELDTEFEKICHEIHIARQKRGESPSKYAPRNYHVLPRMHLSTSKSSNSSDVQKVFCKIPESEDKINSIEDISLSNSCPTRFSKRLRGMGAASPPSNFESIKKTKIFTAPKRTTGYMIWRRRKSPWFGCPKYIRRRIKYPKDISRDKIRKCTNVLQCKVSNPLSPVPEIDIPDMQKTSILNTIDNNESYIKETQAQKVATNENLPDSFRGISNNTENIQGCSPEIVFVSAVKDQVDQNLKHSTSRFNTAICCDISQDSNCSKDTSISSLSTNTSEDTPDVQCNKIGTEEEKQDLLNDAPSEMGTKLCENFTADQENWISRKEIEIDRNLIHNILDKLVKDTEHCTVDTLQQLFSILQQCIYRHRREWDKQNLILELENEIQRFHQHSLS